MSTVLNRPPRILRWSKEFYYQMGELGWFDGKRVELIDGDIIIPLFAPHSQVAVADLLP
jgi:hypothetical protein